MNVQPDSHYIKYEIMWFPFLHVEKLEAELPIAMDTAASLQMACEALATR